MLPGDDRLQPGKEGVEPDAADDLLSLWSGGPPALAGDLSPLVRERMLRPALTELPDDPAPRLRAAGAALAHAFEAHGDDFRASLIAAVDAKILHGASYKADWITALFDDLRTWCATGDHDAPFHHAKLAHLRRERLIEKTNKTAKGPTPDSPICDAIPAYLDALDAIACATTGVICCTPLRSTTHS